MDLMVIAVTAQGLDMRVGMVEVSNLLAGEVSGQAFLPEIVGAFDLTFGLRRRGIPE